jgi:hypothetical protein
VRQTSAEKKQADDAKLLKQWRRWHREQLEQALAGPHGAMMAELVDRLSKLTQQSASALLHFVRAQNWKSIDANTRFTALHEINVGIAAAREREGMAQFDDALWGERSTLFQVARELMK